MRQSRLARVDKHVLVAARVRLLLVQIFLQNLELYKLLLIEASLILLALARQLFGVRGRLLGRIGIPKHRRRQVGRVNIV